MLYLIGNNVVKPSIITKDMHYFSTVSKAVFLICVLSYQTFEK